MYNTILLAAAFQRWERYSAHALGARELALFIASNTSKRLHVLSVYECGFASPTETSGGDRDIAAWQSAGGYRPGG